MSIIYEVQYKFTGLILLLRNQTGIVLRCETCSVYLFKDKFHYASWFEAGSEMVRSWFELKFGLSSSLLSAN